MSPMINNRRSRLRAALAVVIAAGLLTSLVGYAAAVHDVSVFQLDGDAQKATGSTAHLEDWDVICKANPTTCTPAAGVDFSGLPTTTSTRSAHVNDGASNATIFVGGGSKDPQDITEWRWKDEAGGLPDKDNLLHSYVARYEVPASTTCPTAGGATTCVILYFGADRFANDGDAQMGFWFLQKRTTLNPDVKQNGAFIFNGAHVNGDLLVISDFSNGGAVATINVYKWQDGGLLFLAGSDAAKCDPALVSPDRFCGIVNPTDGTISPWPFLDKKGNSTFLNGELYEAGINLSHPDINLAGQCFSSFVTETRSSTSTTAVLKDFVLGQLPVCQPTMTTQASVPGPVLPGTAVHDTATITVTGAANPDDPTGDVTFYLCGPIATGDCGTAGGNLIGTGTLAGGANTTDGIASAVSPTVNDSTQTGNRFTLAPGRYCFRATWPGDANYVLAQPLNVTNSTTECFLVADTSSMTTHQIWLPNDRATVTSGGGTALNGTVKFELYSGSTCAGTKLWPQAGDPAGTGEFTLTSAASPATVGPTTNTAVKVEADATVSWKVVFTSSDSGVSSPAAPTCEVSTLDLTPNQ